MTINYLTIDVEDYFQVSAFEKVAPPGKWDTYESRVSRNTYRLLDLLDSMRYRRSAIGYESRDQIDETDSMDPTDQTDQDYEHDTSPRRKRIVSRHFHPESDERNKESSQSRKSCLKLDSPRATFFVVGWIAEKHPDLLKEIADRGHEIGCHSYMHRKIYDIGPDKFREDTKKAKEILEDLTGGPIYGYRAPSYSITKRSLWALEILLELGFTYDSSVFPIHHDMYGIPTAPRVPFLWDMNGDSPRIIENLKAQISNPRSRFLVEYPISTARIFGQKVPIAGGGYFRLFPYWFTRWALRKINDEEGQPFVFYLHPWEIDPDQPRFDHAGMLSKFRHYNNLHKTAERFRRLLMDFTGRRIS